MKHLAAILGVKPRRVSTVLASMRDRDQVKLVRDGVTRLWTRKQEQGAA